MQDKLDAYAKRYYVHKAPRKLIWQPALGQVTLSLQLGPEKRDFSVSPTQASILLFFQVHLFCLPSCMPSADAALLLGIARCSVLSLCAAEAAKTTGTSWHTNSQLSVSEHPGLGEVAVVAQ